MAAARRPTPTDGSGKPPLRMWLPGSARDMLPSVLKDFSNVATWDRALRIVAGIAMLWLGWSDLVDGLSAIALVIFAWFPLLTGLLGWCPVYSILGVSTLRRPPGASKVR